MALSTYLRATALSQSLPRRRKSGVSIQDREAIAQVIGLLGQSRIANNLNQLAYHANIGTLEFDEDANAQIHEAYDMALAMRADLLKALGFKS